MHGLARQRNLALQQKSYFRKIFQALCQRKLRRH
jgi:hypothetical protein